TTGHQAKQSRLQYCSVTLTKLQYFANVYIRKQNKTMAEQVILDKALESGELAPDPTVLPQGDALRAVYTEGFGAMAEQIPADYRMAADGESGNITLDPNNDDRSPERLRRAFVRQMPQRAYEESWWPAVAEALEGYGIPSPDARAIR